MSLAGMGRRVLAIKGEYHDALSKGGRKVHTFKAGARARIKRRYRRRERRLGKREIDT